MTQLLTNAQIGGQETIAIKVAARRGWACGRTL